MPIWSMRKIIQAVTAVLLVPLVTLSRLFAEYQLGLAVQEPLDTILVLVALGIGLILVLITFHSWLACTTATILYLAWSVASYTVIAVFIGCLWAPACV